MAILQVTRWIVMRLAQLPAVWLGVLLLGAFWPAALTFSPLGLTTRSGALELLYEVAFLAALLGTVAGLALCPDLDWALRRATTGRRIVVEALAIGTAQVAFLVCAWLPWFLAGGSGPSSLLATLPALLHLCALALLLRRLRLPAPLTLLLVPLLAWLLPALLPTAGPLSALVGHVTDCSRHLAPAPQSLYGADAWIAAWRPIIGLIAAALLLDDGSRS